MPGIQAKCQTGYCKRLYEQIRVLAGPAVNYNSLSEFTDHWGTDLAFEYVIGVPPNYTHSTLDRDWAIKIQYGTLQRPSMEHGGRTQS